MKKIYIYLMILIAASFLYGCDKKNRELTEGEILHEISMAILRADYGGLKTGNIIENDVTLPTFYKDVTITWKSSNPEIIDNTGSVVRPNECWVESRDQQGQQVFEGLNDLWPVILTGTYTYKGLEDTHKIIVRVKPADGYTCNKYKG